MTRIKNKKLSMFFSYFFIILVVFAILLTVAIKTKGKKETKPVELNYYDISNYQIKDQRLKEISENSIIDKNGSIRENHPYLAHPDILAIKKSEEETLLLNYYVDGHGKGETKLKKAIYKEGMTTKDLIWEEQKLREDFKKTEETPTLFTLNFKDGRTKYLFVSARPGWNTVKYQGQGFFATLSDDGINWQEFENFYGEDAKRKEYYLEKGKLNPIVAMSSMIRVRKNNEFVDEWDFLFHDYNFRVYKIRLSFNENNQMVFSKPEIFMKEYEEDYQKKYAFCEPLFFRNPKNLEQIIVIFRANYKISNSFISISNDNGKTYQEPKELPNYLTGERHKMLALDDGRIAISFRKIDFYNNSKKLMNFYSHGTMMWIGQVEDLLSLSEDNKGILLKVFHTFIKDKYTYDSNGDTGYCGLFTIKDKKTNDIKVIISSYGKFLQDDLNNTLIAAKIINISEIDRLISNNKIKKQKI